MQDQISQSLELLATSSPLLFASSHAPINAHFNKCSADFVVRELPLYDFSGDGEHLILHIQKKDLTTPQALSIISSATGAKIRDMGFAGLKDKQGLTSQFISLPSVFENALKHINSDKLSILNITKHNNKIRTGYLKGNSFFIRLKKVSPSDAVRLENAINFLSQNGLPNYFGFQRFGKFGDNALKGLELLNALNNGQKSKLNPKMQNFLLSAFQSELFNRYLSFRLKINHFAREFSAQELAKIFNINKDDAKQIKAQKQFFKLIRGEVLGHYPSGALFLCESLDDEIIAFNEKRKSPQILLLGKKAFSSKDLAKELEDAVFAPFYIYESLLSGGRRHGVIYPSDISYKYDEQNAHFRLSFSLVKGAYATIFLREILRRDDILSYQEE